MKINLKEFEYQLNSLDFISSTKSAKEYSKICQEARALYDLLLLIKTDLEMGGESIIELDKPRSEAIKERDGDQGPV